MRRAVMNHRISLHLRFGRVLSADLCTLLVAVVVFVLFGGANAPGLAVVRRAPPRSTPRQMRTSIRCISYIIVGPLEQSEREPRPAPRARARPQQRVRRPGRGGGRSPEQQEARGGGGGSGGGRVALSGARLPPGARWAREARRWRRWRRARGARGGRRASVLVGERLVLRGHEGRGLGRRGLRGPGRRAHRARARRRAACEIQITTLLSYILIKKANMIQK